MQKPLVSPEMSSRRVRSRETDGRWHASRWLAARPCVGVVNDWFGRPLLKPASSLPSSWLVDAFVACLVVDNASQEQVNSFKVHWFEYPPVEASVNIFLPFFFRK